MTRRILLAAAIVCTLALGHAGAHFVWLDVPATAGNNQIEIYFSETAEPGESHLISKISHAKAWVRTPDGQSGKVVLTTAAGDEPTLLRADWPANIARTSCASAEASCQYGVLERGETAVLLNYYAKRLLGDWQAAGEKFTRAEDLACDVVPSLQDGKLGLRVFHAGKLSANSDVVVTTPAGVQVELKSDSQGRAELPLTKAGRYTVLASNRELDKAGTADGKAYSQTWHYTTLVLDVPASAVPASGVAEKASTTPAAPAAGSSAMELLKQSRDARSMWQNFPGFSADLTIEADGQKLPGKATIESSGSVTLSMPKSPVSEWVDEQLRSLVQHRMPDGEVSETEVKYADDDVAHPLGRKITLGDGEMQSAYRIRDNAILEVNRSMGPMRFTISVQEVLWTVDKKYLPRSFTMNFFDTVGGQLKTSLAYRNDWQRVGGFDLPKTILEIAARDGKSVTRQIDFTNCKLTETK